MGAITYLARFANGPLHGEKMAVQQPYPVYEVATIEEIRSVVEAGQGMPLVHTRRYHLVEVVAISPAVHWCYYAMKALETQ